MEIFHDDRKSAIFVSFFPRLIFALRFVLALILVFPHHFALSLKPFNRTTSKYFSNKFNCTYCEWMNMYIFYDHYSVVDFNRLFDINSSSLELDACEKKPIWMKSKVAERHSSNVWLTNQFKIFFSAIVCSFASG